MAAHLLFLLPSAGLCVVAPRALAPNTEENEVENLLKYTTKLVSVSVSSVHPPHTGNWGAWPGS